MVDEATNAGATVDVAPLVESIQTSMQWSVLSDWTMIPGAESAYSTMNKYLNMLIDENGTSKTMSVSDAQRISQSINRQTKALYNGWGWDILTNIALEGINRQLRPAIDTAVEKVLDTPWLKDLKKSTMIIDQYRAINNQKMTGYRQTAKSVTLWMTFWYIRMSRIMMSSC